MIAEDVEQLISSTLNKTRLSPYVDPSTTSAVLLFDFEWSIFNSTHSSRPIAYYELTLAP